MENSVPIRYRRTAEQLSKEMDVLQNQLFNAKAHFDIVMGLLDSWPKYPDVFRSSLAFWNLTTQAHSGMTVLHLCRLYDQNEQAIHLPGFLMAVDNSEHLFNIESFKDRIGNTPGRDVVYLARFPRVLDREQLQQDVLFCSKIAPLVKKLIVWRNNIVAHSSYTHLISEQKPFHEKFPMPWNDLRTLIDTGFAIVNRYSSVFGASQYSENFLSHQKNDYLFVLDSVQSRLKGHNP